MVSRRAFLTGLSVSAFSVGGCLGFGEEREVYSEYRYRASVNPTAPVSGVTLYLPAPVRDGNVAFSDALTGTDGIRPEDWSYAIAETDRGPMVEITVEELRPATRPYEIALDLQSDSEINTREAIATEPTLSGKVNMQAADCQFPHPDSWEDRLQCYTYESSFYGEFEPAVGVAVDTTLIGENSWFTGGWTGNEYTDVAHGFVDGTGWASGQGSVREGSGRY